MQLYDKEDRKYYKRIYETGTSYMIQDSNLYYHSCYIITACPSWEYYNVSTVLFKDTGDKYDFVAFINYNLGIKPNIITLHGNKHFDVCDILHLFGTPIGLAHSYECRCEMTQDISQLLKPFPS